MVAGLTNQPTGARDPAKRSRGELPLAFAAYPDARTAVTEVCARLDPAAYNPCWMLVGDRHALFSVEVSGGHRAGVEELPPGRYVLENAPLWQPSAKQQRVAGLVAALDGTGLDGAGWTRPRWTGRGWTGRDGLRPGSPRCSGIISPPPVPSRAGRAAGRARPNCQRRACIRSATAPARP